MMGFSTNIEAKTLSNTYFREVLFTGAHCQVVVMTLLPGEDIGMERHQDADQFIRVESGEGEAIIDGERHRLGDGAAVVIPAGSLHNVTNISATEPLRLYTVYSSPQHAAWTIHKTKADALLEHDHADHGTLLL